MRLTPGIGRSAAVLLAAAFTVTACANQPVSNPLAQQPAALDTLPDLGISRLLDRSDRVAATAARTAALGPRRAGEQALWRNVQTGNSGAVTPIDIHTDSQGRECRRLQHVFTINGSAERSGDQVDGTACRQANGDWIAVEE